MPARAPQGEEDRRRGIAGIFFLYKIAGASARSGAPLATVQRVTAKAAANVRSMGVALAPCILPAAGVPTFELPAGQMEIGMGIHGEPGVRRGPLETADQIAEQLTTAVLDDLPFASGDEVAVLVNGLGATPKEELYILYRGVNQVLKSRGIRVHRVWVGEYATSLEMAGASLWSERPRNTAPGAAGQKATKWKIDRQPAGKTSRLLRSTASCL